MTSVSPPTYYFNGITFNSAFYTTSSSGGLSQAQANALYLKKNTADTASALETFTGGIVSDSIQSTTTSTDMSVGSSQVSGAMNIGNGASRGGAVQISNGNSNSSNVSILTGQNNTGQLNIANATIGTNTVGVNISNGNTSGQVTIGNQSNNTEFRSSTINIQTEPSTSATTNIRSGTVASGAVNIASGGGTAGTSTVSVNIGSGITSGAVTIGNPANTVQINGSLSMGTGKNITLQPTLSYVSPVAGQLGFVNENTGTLIPAVNTDTNITSTSPTTAGVYLVIGSFTVTTSSTTGYTVWLNTTSASQVGNKGVLEVIILNGWPQQTYVTSAVFTSTVAPTFYLSMRRTSASDSVSGKISVTRIA